MTSEDPRPGLREAECCQTCLISNHERSAELYFQLKCERGPLPVGVENTYVCDAYRVREHMEIPDAK